MSYLFAVACLLALAAPSAFAQSPSPVGDWYGALGVGGRALRLVMHITGEPGAFKATMDSPDQGAKDIPMDSVTLAGSRVTLGLKMAGASYEGDIDAGGNTMAGKWRQMGSEMPLTLHRSLDGKPVDVKPDKVPEPIRPQNPKRPYPYREVEVTFATKTPGVRLAGTLTLPRGKGPFPAVMLLTGSGAQDRDEELLGHRPFLVWSDALTRRGIAVLRCDDRGVGKSGGSMALATTSDFAWDALCGVAFLRKRPEIDPRRVGLMGHSEGACTAALAASRSADVAFVVHLAGTGVTGDQVILAQAEAIGRAQGLPEETLRAAHKTNSTIYSIVKARKGDIETAEALRKALTESFDALPEDQRKAMGDPQAGIAAQIQQVTSPWFVHFLTHDPTTALRKVRCPILALNGELDLQVLPDQNLPPIRRALAAAGNRRARLVRLPGLNHLFQTCDTGNPSLYGEIKETVSPSALKLVCDWVVATTRTAASRPTGTPKR
ncbi:MAG: alpha/beta fold hydrolase [Armatimonadetes bacterium]|nr:alpha/beta fold hydrolase [Armatimonadota bacterium]